MHSSTILCQRDPPIALKQHRPEQPCPVAQVGRAASELVAESESVAQVRWAVSELVAESESFVVAKSQDVVVALAESANSG